MDQEEAYFYGDVPKIGIFMADSGLYQRTFPDNVPHAPGGVAGMNELLLSLKYRDLTGEDVTADSAALMQQIGEDTGLYNDYVTSGPFPHFFGMAMPLLKGGIPLRPMQLENLDRYEAYLKEYDTLILSYEFLKPRKPEYHEILAKWVKQGGKLIYVGDGTDPYHRVQDWWNTGGRTYSDPAEHFFELLGVPMAEGTCTAGKGTVAYYTVSPGRITLTAEAARKWQNFVRDTAAPDYVWTNRFDMQRGPYRIISIMDEGMTADAHTVRGCYVDMLDPNYPVVQEKNILPGENALLFDLDAIRGEPVRIIGTSARIFSLEETGEGYRLTCKAADRIHVTMRLKLNKPVLAVSAVDESGMQLKVDSAWDAQTSTVWLSFPSTNQLTTVNLNE